MSQVITTHPDGRALSARAERILGEQLQAARVILKTRYAFDMHPAPGLHYVPYKMDALGLYAISGPWVYSYGNPIDGFYTVDDFGQLVRVPLAQVHPDYYN